MKQVLSLLLLIPFLSVQVLAGLGGPYEDAFSYSKAAWAGTYGISLQGVPLGDTEAASPNSVSTTGVMAVSIPNSGFCTARVLIFDKGLMYFGSGQGNLDPRSKHLHLITQASHYAFIESVTLPGGVTTLVDYILSGQVDLKLNVDYLAGVVSATGKAVFARYDPAAEELNRRSSTLTDGNTASGNVALTPPTTSTVVTVNTQTIQEPDGSTTTVTTTTNSGTADPSPRTSTTTSQVGSSVNQAYYTNLNEMHHTTPLTGSTAKDSDIMTVSDPSTVDLRPGMTVSGPGIPYGTTIIAAEVDDTDGILYVTLSKPATANGTDVKLSCDPSSIVFLELTADGIRETTDVVALAPLSAPNLGTNYQVGGVQVVPGSAATPTGTTGTAAGGGGAGA